MPEQINFLEGLNPGQQSIGPQQSSLLTNSASMPMSEQPQMLKVKIIFQTEKRDGTPPDDIYCKDFLEAVRAVEKVLEFKSNNFIQCKKDFDHDGEFGFKRKGIIAWIMMNEN